MTSQLPTQTSDALAERGSGPPPGRRFHVALGVTDVAESVRDYSARLGCAPAVHVPNEYALWQTAALNFSIRRAPNQVGLRHLGWEDPNATAFGEETDTNGIVWERFTAEQQREEIERYWPSST